MAARTAPGQVFALVGFALGLFAVLCYGYGAKELYQFSFFSAALNTSLLFPLLGIGILCARPDQGLISTLTSTNLGGSLARRILPVALTLPFLLGWLWLRADHAGLFETEFGFAISTTTNVLIFAALIWFGSSLTSFSFRKILLVRGSPAAVFRATLQPRRAVEKIAEADRVDPAAY